MHGSFSSDEKDETLKTNVIARTAAVVGAAALAVSGAQGVANAQDAGPDHIGSIKTNSVENFSWLTGQLPALSGNFAQAPVEMSIGLPFMVLSAVLCQPTTGECQ